MPALSDSDVHAWVARLGDVGLDHAAAVALLSSDERARLTRFRSSLHARRYALAHAFVRTTLASYLDADPRALGFAYGSRGKPYLSDDRSLFFNLSHSGDVVAIAVTRVGEVGIDVEIDRDVPNAGAIARELMSGEELAWLEAHHAAARSRAFLEWWTRREAAAKATGEGIAELGRSDSSLELLTRRLETQADYVAAVALTEPWYASAPTRPEDERAAHGTGGSELSWRA